MNQYLVIYRSVTQAQIAGRALTDAGIGCQVVRTPSGLSGLGCSYSVRLPERHGTRAFAILNDLRPAYYKVFLGGGGGYREVRMP